MRLVKLNSQYFEKYFENIPKIAENKYMAENYPVLSGKGIFTRIKQSLEPDKKGVKDLIVALDFKKGTVYGWDEKNIIPKTQDIFKISQYLDVSLYWLLTGEDERGITEEERKLLKDFDNLDQKGKTLALEHIEGLIQHFPQKRTLKKSTAG